MTMAVKQVVALMVVRAAGQRSKGARWRSQEEVGEDDDAPPALAARLRGVGHHLVLAVAGVEEEGPRVLGVCCEDRGRLLRHSEQRIAHQQRLGRRMVEGGILVLGAGPGLDGEDLSTRG